MYEHIYEHFFGPLRDNITSKQKQDIVNNAIREIVMGYHVYQGDTDFYIAKEDWDKLSDYIRKEHGLLESDDVVEWVCYDYMWNMCIDKDGNVVDIKHESEKLGYQDDYFFNMIAPYVKDGSFINMQGEDGDLWRYSFRDGKFKIVYPEIVWPE